VRPSCTVSAGLGPSIAFRPDKDGTFKFVIACDDGTCKSASLDAAARTLGETIAQALQPGLPVFSLPE
jgi:hypothetical protein